MMNEKRGNQTSQLLSEEYYLQRYKMKVTELARAAGVGSEVVRYYTRIGLLKPRRQRNNGYRLYEEQDVIKLRFVRKAKALGYTLKEVKTILNHAEQGESPCPLVRKIIEKRIEENRKELENAIALQKRMEDATKEWEKLPDGVPNSDSICHLIESFVED